MTESIYTLIVDDHAVVRNGIRRALEANPKFIVREAATHAEAMAVIAQINPNLIIVDINLPDGSGLDLVRWVRDISARIAVVVLTFNEADEYLLAAMKAGASAYLNKSAPLPELLSAVHRSLESPMYFSAKEIAGALSRRQDRFQLSQRELEILSQLATDLSLKDLAKTLYITESTLKTHLTHLYRKLAVKNRLQAINLARRSGLL